MQNFVRFVREIRGYWRVISLIAVLTLINSGLSLLPPQYIKYLTDHLSDQAVMAHLPVRLMDVFLAVVAIAASQALFGFFLQLSITFLGQQFKLDMRGKLYAHMQTLSLSFFEKSQTGKLMSNITNDVASLDQLLSGGFVNVLQDSVTLIVVLFYVFHVNWRLALVSLAVYPIYVVNYLAFIGRIKVTSGDVRDQREVLYGDLQEKLAGVQVVKSYAKERYEVRQFVGETRNLFGLNMRINVMSTGLWTIAEFIGSGCGTALLLWYGGRLVIEGHLTPGTLMAFYAYITGYLYAPTVRLIQLNDQIARTNVALGRIFYTLDTAPLVSDIPDAKALPEVRGDVKYEHVCFEYEPGQPVIMDVNLDVKAGEMIAFVGYSGSGKTTLVNLLLRHYDVTAGRITIDGYDLRDVRLNTLRRQVGVVIQETVLFNTTIRENIRYGRLEASNEDVERAADAANIGHVIEALPMGYDTRIGEAGIKLSGGEKQRIAIARAILSDPRILILDEATSSLDSETESVIQEALDRLLEGRTSFIVAHRLSTIVKANQIVVMEKGIVREIGSHSELLAQGGLYAGLYNQQFKVALEGADGAGAHLAPAGS